jgi:hypothetical protein
MNHGRVVKATWAGRHVLYVVAEEDGIKAAAIVARAIGRGPQVEALGRASCELLTALALSPGEFKKALP